MFSTLAASAKFSLGAVPGFAFCRGASWLSAVVPVYG